MWLCYIGGHSKVNLNSSNREGEGRGKGRGHILLRYVIPIDTMSPGNRSSVDILCHLLLLYTCTMHVPSWFSDQAV